ncbi:MAG: hypothetical protein AAFR59_11720, partial [Bacteroidota bacterium]
ESAQNRSHTPKLSAALAYYLNPNMTFVGSIHQAWVGAADSLAVDPTRQRRNLHFRSPITELRMEYVYEFLEDKKFGRRYNRKNHWTPFVSLGISVMRMNPQAQYQGRWVDLQPLGTEGQLTASSESVYSPWQIAVPLGIGIEYRFALNWGLQASFTYQHLFTDYLDDVSRNFPRYEEIEDPVGRFLANPSQLDEFTPGSPRGNPDKNDSYSFLNIQAIYYFSPRR